LVAAIAAVTMPMPAPIRTIFFSCGLCRTARPASLTTPQAAAAFAATIFATVATAALTIPAEGAGRNVTGGSAGSGAAGGGIIEPTVDRIIVRMSGLVSGSVRISFTASRLPSRAASATALLRPSARASMMPSSRSS